METAVRRAARLVLLAGAPLLAFLGGHRPEPRLWAAAAAWALVAVAALAAPRPLPRAGSARLALAALAALAAWTLASTLWAPQAGPAWADGQRVVGYAGALVAACALLRGRAALREAEVAVAAGALLVVAGGLAERLLPWLVDWEDLASAQGRLAQPLAYWNAMGLLAAVGLVLGARLAGDPARSRRLRAAAAAAAVPLGAGLHLAFSRGALFAVAAGLLALLVAAPARAQLRGTALAVGAAALGGLAVAPFGEVVRAQDGGSAAQGAAALLVLTAVAVAAAALRARAGDPPGALRLPRGAPWLALAAVVAAFAIVVAAGARSAPGAELPGADAGRLGSTQSNRYDYWRVAAGMVADRPVHGEGAGGFAVRWLAERRVREGARDAHSLPVETAAELGLAGLALLLALVAGVGRAARDAHRLAPALAAGPIAGLCTWAAHASLDWDWELPAVTLPALVLAGGLLALADLRVAPSAR